MNYIRISIVQAMLTAILAFAALSPVRADPGCNDANMFGARLVSDICWSCMLPVRMLGLGGSADDPPGAVTESLCVCYDGAGVPNPGITLGVWMPYRLFEEVRNPYCMPALGGLFLHRDFTSMSGPNDSVRLGSNKSHWHSHVYSFPLATMLELVTNKYCNPGGYSDMDVLMMSEFDPVVGDEELSPFIYFETAMFANPVAIAACSLECGQVTAGIAPTSNMYWWCAGCWGGIYPMVNSTLPTASNHNDTSLVSARQLAVKHRRGMGHRTYGEDAYCGGKLEIFLPKEQYKWSQIFPLPEATGRCCHWTGESEFKTGGVSRFIPATGEDQLHMLWRYTDCCMN